MTLTPLAFTQEFEVQSNNKKNKQSTTNNSISQFNHKFPALNGQHWSSKGRSSSSIFSTSKSKPSGYAESSLLLEEEKKQEELENQLESINLLSKAVSQCSVNKSSGLLPSSSRKSSFQRAGTLSSCPSSSIFESNSKANDQFTIEWSISNQVCDVVENSSNSITLPRLGLESIPEALKDLLYVSMISDGIQMFLYENCIKTIPKWFCSLDQVTVLILRNNLIQEIPSCIKNMRNLKEFNMSNNRLQFVPSSLLQLKHLKIFTASGNPFYPPSTTKSINERALADRREKGYISSLVEIASSLLTDSDLHKLETDKLALTLCKFDSDKCCSVCGGRIFSHRSWLTLYKYESVALGEVRVPVQYNFCKLACARPFIVKEQQEQGNE